MEKIQWIFVSDNYLVERIKNTSCEESLLELANRHGGLFFKIVKKYAKFFESRNINIREVSNDKNLIIWKAANTFNNDKNVKFSTWLANQVKYFCLNTLNKKNKDRLSTVGDEILDYIEQVEPSCTTNPNKNESGNFIEFVDNILNQLKDKRIKKIFSMRYSKTEKKPSWCSVASKLNISTQTAINLHNRGITILKKKMGSEKFLDNV